MKPSRRQPKLRIAARAALSMLATMAGGAHAIELDTGNPDWSVRWDNTLKGSTIYRLENADPRLVNSFGPGVPQALNFNAGNDNFRNKAIVSKRLDVLSEFDAVFERRFGLRLSAAAWHDGAYRGTTDAQDRSGPTPVPGVFGPGNGQTPYNEFPAAAKDLAGRKAELLDAFVFGGWTLGENQKLTARIGRHALQYGEALFFGDNGIARAQGPIDVLKLLSSPNAQFKEIVRPVPQVSAQFQLSPQVSVGGYYQFRWEADRMPPAGSYFSSGNTIWGGGSQLPEFVGIPAGPIAGNYLATPAGDRKPPGSGQFGLQLKWRLDETDLGFYYARYHDKGGQLYTALNFANKADSRWYFAFPEAIQTVGVSATRSLGTTNLAFEASLRKNMPLVNGNILYPLGSPRPEPATGNTAHANLSWLSTLPPTPLAKEAGLIGEIAWNRVLSKNDPGKHLDHGRTRDSTALQVIFTPTYRQLVPRLDLSVPIGLRYVVDGRSAITGLGWGAKGTGTASVGLEGNFDGIWQFTLTYNRFLGRAEPTLNYSTLEYSHGNPLADRSYLSASLRRTF